MDHVGPFPEKNRRACRPRLRRPVPVEEPRASSGPTLPVRARPPEARARKRGDQLPAARPRVAEASAPCRRRQDSTRRAESSAAVDLNRCRPYRYYKRRHPHRWRLMHGIHAVITPPKRSTLASGPARFPDPQPDRRRRRERPDRRLLLHRRSFRTASRDPIHVERARVPRGSTVSAPCRTFADATAGLRSTRFSFPRKATGPNCSTLSPTSVAGVSAMSKSICTMTTTLRRRSASARRIHRNAVSPPRSAAPRR